MLPFRRILFPVDFSDRCRGAAQYAELFTGRFDSELILLNVAEPYVVENEPFHTKTERLHRLSSFLPEDFRFFNVRHVVEEGDAGNVIVDFAKRNDVDLIMMPTHGYGTFRRFLLGSVTAKVLHDSPCPVWTGVHTEQCPPVEQLHCKEIVCGVEPRPRDVAAISAANQLVREFGGRLTVVIAIPTPAMQTDVMMSSAMAEYLTTALDSARGAGKNMLSEAHAQGCVCVGTGSPAQIIRETARQREADLVVIGRSHSEGVLGRLRADAYSIIRDSPCPVLSV